MLTSFLIIRPEPPLTVVDVDLPEDPGFQRLKAIIEPIIRADRAHAHFEHVSVLHDGKPADMFVDDEGVLHDLPANMPATRVYHANSIARGEPHLNGVMPGAPIIRGVAILSSRRVWF